MVAAGQARDDYSWQSWATYTTRAKRANYHSSELWRITTTTESMELLYDDCPCQTHLDKLVGKVFSPEWISKEIFDV
jgi:hypothetical protein